MARKGSSLRLFVGVYPPPDVAAALLASLKALDLPAHRLTPAEQVHLTLQFIGDTLAMDLEDTTESVRRAAAGLASFALTPIRLIALPPRGRARLVAAETDAPATLLEVQRRLATRLSRRPRRNPGDRFLPHLTLCRLRPPRRLEGVDRELDTGSFEVEHLALMKSTLQPDGARHELVEAVTLRR